MNNRRAEMRPTCFKWFGNMSALGDFLNKKSWCSPWGILKLINSYFRALGVVSFACNPFTGILIFCAMVMGNPHVAIASVMTGIISILTCKLIKAPDEDVCNGVSVFNSILVGAILTIVLPPILDIPLNVNYWIILAVAGFLTNFIDQGLQSMMAPSKLPVQSVPFNIVAALVFLIFRTKTKGFELVNHDFEVTQNETVEWQFVLEGTIRGAGQIFGVGDITPSILIWLGFFLYSPLLTFMSYVGSVIGAVLAVMFNVRPLVDVYVGLWSFNSLLAAGGITFFVVPTPVCILLSVVNAFVALSVQAALTPLFTQTAMPVFSFPFNVAIMFILAISLRKESPLKFVSNRTFPEEHILKYYGLCGSHEFDDWNDETDRPLRIGAKV